MPSITRFYSISSDARISANQTVMFLDGSQLLNNRPDCRLSVANLAQCY